MDSHSVISWMHIAYNYLMISILQLNLLFSWLSQSQSIRSIVKNFPVVMQYLEGSSHDYPTAEGLFKRMSTIEFMVKLHALNDVLYHLNTLNELYQREKTHPYDVKVSFLNVIRVVGN